MKWQCQDSQLAKTKRSCQESARPDAAVDVPCVQSRATVCLCVSWGGRGENAALAKTFSHWCQPDTCLGTPHGSWCHLILSHRSVGGPLFPFSSHAVLCQDWSWHLLVAVQPISGEILSGGLCWMVCWQQAIGTDCQFLLTTLYNHVFALTRTITPYGSHIMSSHSREADT